MDPIIHILYQHGHLQ